jgi:hypothetical protein
LHLRREQRARRLRRSMLARPAGIPDEALPHSDNEPRLTS